MCHSFYVRNEVFYNDNFSSNAFSALHEVLLRSYHYKDYTLATHTTNLSVFCFCFLFFIFAQWPISLRTMKNVLTNYWVYDKIYSIFLYRRDVENQKYRFPSRTRLSSHACVISYHQLHTLT